MATKNTEFLPVAIAPETIAALDAIASNKELSVGSQFQRAFATANAIGQLRALLTPAVMRPIMELQGTPLGFLADQKYPEDIVRDALIEAVLSGVNPIGNEWNIIAGRMYITKAGMKHKLHDVPGLSFSVTCGFPKLTDNGAALIVSLDWTYNGKSEHKDLPIPVRVNRGMGADAINGKATRKAYAWLYEHITGQNVNDGETEPPEKIDRNTGAETNPGGGVIIDAEVSPLEQDPPAKTETAKPDAKPGDLF